MYTNEIWGANLNQAKERHMKRPRHHAEIEGWMR